MPDLPASSCLLGDTKRSLLAHRVVQFKAQYTSQGESRLVRQHFPCFANSLAQETQNFCDYQLRRAATMPQMRDEKEVPGRSGDLPRPLTLCDAIVAPASPHGPHRSLPPRRTARQIIASRTGAGRTTSTRTTSASVTSISAATTRTGVTTPVTKVCSAVTTSPENRRR